ncbi:probable G-protein coupled receptor Mth-like 14 [Anopheles nili]|uniref:probable G-protein coupled receptor Mth-like 14 n=1 Tax=Anopheles nili TaxID=185578 RepID=UPI00237A89ED|nr:probable G-protein coupled receptor Mth-like 14 [Anopheles nili]
MKPIASASARQWLALALCGALASVVVGSFDSSGQGEFEYEEYDDDSPYQGKYDPEADDVLEDFADHFEVLDPITDDDISYSGYEYDEQLERADENATYVSAVLKTTLDNDTRSAIDVEKTSLNETHSASSIGDHTTIKPYSTDVEMPSQEEERTCSNREILSTQPVYENTLKNVIKMCCPQGESLMEEHYIYVSCFPNDIWGGGDSNKNLPEAIMAKFYNGCIEDLEEPVILGVRYGNPCSEGAEMVSFSARTNDSLYVIQNGSLLVIYGQDVFYNIYDAYCLDYDRNDGTLIGYVCPQQLNLVPDVIEAQLMLLTLCLIVAIPLLLTTALLYIIIPELHDLHGKAIAMNCINFALALLLQCFFQYRNQKNRVLTDDMLLANYAEYFLLATFFWLLANCANNCILIWYYEPKQKDRSSRRENFLFVVWMIIAQIIPLFIILLCSKTKKGNPAKKHYLFISIITSATLGVILYVITLIGIRKLTRMYYYYTEVRQRLMDVGKESDIESYRISGSTVNKLIYMTRYTGTLLLVMGIIWTVMTVTYYKQRELPIYYDILFGVQGIFMFIIFVCMPKPMVKIKNWFIENNHCIKFCNMPPTTPDPVSRHTFRSISQMTETPAKEPTKFLSNPFKYLPE